jgi:hypothetical protein
VHDAQLHTAWPGHVAWHAAEVLPLPHVTEKHWHEVESGAEVGVSAGAATATVVENAPSSTSSSPNPATTFMS